MIAIRNPHPHIRFHVQIHVHIKNVGVTVKIIANFPKMKTIHVYGILPLKNMKMNVSTFTKKKKSRTFTIKFPNSRIIIYKRLTSIDSSDETSNKESSDDKTLNKGDLINETPNTDSSSDESSNKDSSGDETSNTDSPGDKILIKYAWCNKKCFGKAFLKTAFGESCFVKKIFAKQRLPFQKKRGKYKRLKNRKTDDSISSSSSDDESGGFNIPFKRSCRIKILAEQRKVFFKKRSKYKHLKKKKTDRNVNSSTSDDENGDFNIPFKRSKRIKIFDTQCQPSLKKKGKYKHLITKKNDENVDSSNSDDENEEFNNNGKQPLLNKKKYKFSQKNIARFLSTNTLRNSGSSSTSSEPFYDIQYERLNRNRCKSEKNKFVSAIDNITYRLRSHSPSTSNYTLVGSRSRNNSQEKEQTNTTNFLHILPFACLLEESSSD